MVSPRFSAQPGLQAYAEQLASADDSEALVYLDQLAQLAELFCQGYVVSVAHLFNGLTLTRARFARLSVCQRAVLGEARGSAKLALLRCEQCTKQALYSKHGGRGKDTSASTSTPRPRFAF
ncbi:hypothetical protein [Methylocucumis oryzae]|uniref:hypothetical protein n=1 Tax=Methylocucumis oryzae TaxID=1632867 RepID=UPI0006966502|nr:hypothetical protein [Methylocucumis oryzae]